MNTSITALLLCVALTSPAWSADRPASPRGQSAIEVPDTETGVPWKNGKWIEVDYGRPLLRGREGIFGSGSDYGKKVNGGAPVWRAGANQTTRLKTEIPLMVGGTRVAPGSYNVFIDLKESGWTLILSTQPSADKYAPGEKTKLWGAYGYDAKFELARAPMTVTHPDYSTQQLAIDFVDVTSGGGKLRFAWDKTAATVPFTVAR